MGKKSKRRIEEYVAIVNYAVMRVILFDILISQKNSVKLDSAGSIQNYFCILDVMKRDKDMGRAKHEDP